jgi:hypothetical protein
MDQQKDQMKWKQRIFCENRSEKYSKKISGTIESKYTHHLLAMEM